MQKRPVVKEKHIKQILECRPTVYVWTGLGLWMQNR